ncbi:MAG: ATP synthase F0 subunit B [Acidobacteriota bacterium]|nr:ATP synthase F0 subunit B [Acidobacteriota bacterium]
MKVVVGWALVFVCALIFALLVDNGAKHLGIPDYIWLPVNLTLFLYILQRYIGRPMSAFLDARREGIAAELATARTQLEEADQLQADMKKRLAEIEEEIAQIHTRAEAEGAAEAERIAQQTGLDEERFLKRVDDEISRRETETRARLTQDTADLTAQLARDLLSRDMTDADRRRVFDRSLDAMRQLEGED